MELSMAFGYMGKTLFVDLTSGTMREEPLAGQEERPFLGGYGTGSRILYEKMPKGADALGPENILGFVTGPLTGTPLPFVSRFTVVAKSPLTGCWGDANGGGAFGPALKFAGYDAVYFKGCSEKPVYLLLGGESPHLIDAQRLWGMDTYSTDDQLKQKHGARAEAACIGPSGERLSRIAAVITGKGRAAARSGLGAVMGSKRLKAVVALGTNKVPLAHPETVALLRKKYSQQMKDGVGFSAFYRNTGTSGYTEAAIMNGDSPVRNWFGSVNELRDVAPLSYENLKSNYLTRRSTCFGCPMADWGHAIIKEGPYKLAEEAHIPEYETASAFGPYCMNTNYESIIKCNDICNRNGIDTISTGSAIAFAIHCAEEGILSKADMDGMELRWGDHAGIVQLAEKIAKREGIGKLLSEGTKIAAQTIGKGAERFAIHVGGQELPAHDPRFEPTMASIYRNNATPGRHTQDAQFCVPSKLPEHYPNVDFSFSFGNKRDTMHGRAKAQRILSSLNHCVNSSGLCLFGFLATDVDFMPECISAVTGWDVDLDELITTGERIGDMRLLYTIREGVNPLQLPFPAVSIGTPPLADGPTKSLSVDLDLITREFCSEMQWDLNTGMPSGERLKELGLPNLVNEESGNVCTK
jgi:aldehyde:ferredoxin oxidoreductase